MKEGQVPDKKAGTESSLNRGRVIRSTGSWYVVEADKGQYFDCRLKGKFRASGFKSTNPVVVGDYVHFTSEGDDQVIVEIEDRENYVLRRATNLSKRMHIMCANIDCALIVFTITHPVTTLGYLDRLLVTCQAYHIPAVILFNKKDLIVTEEDIQKLSDYISLYEKAGYICVVLSANQNEYKQVLTDLLRDKTSFLVGRSGAGKSSLVNLVAPELDVKAGSVSNFSGRGKHTTTYATMYELPFGGYLIDSPGFKEMTIYDIEKEELGHLFPEFVSKISNCKFSNCLHLNEPGCAIKAAVKSGDIAPSRYHTYLGMMDEIEEEAKDRWK